MQKSEFEAMSDRLREVNKLVKELDPSIRAEAFSVLKGYVAGTATPQRVSGKTEKQSGGTVVESGGDDGVELIPADEAREFLAEHHADKEADNVKAIAALIYSRYGADKFTAAEVNRIADEAGVTVPARVDVTLSGTSVKKKPLFQKVRAGVYRPTIHGERFLKDTYGVTKGTAKRPELVS